MSGIPRPLDYLKSLAEELRSRQDRVRNLIGDAHWLTDGHHKESILRDLLRAHAPSAVLFGTGFVLSEGLSDCSREQDILGVDTWTEMPLLVNGDLIVATHHQVLVAISVKTEFDAGTLRDSLRCLLSSPAASHCWLGAYFFPAKPVPPSERLARSVAGAYAKLVATDGARPTFTLRISDNTLGVVAADPDAQTARAMTYNCGGTATAYFLARAMAHITARRGTSFGALADELDQHEGALESFTAEAGLRVAGPVRRASERAVGHSGSHGGRRRRK